MYLKTKERCLPTQKIHAKNQMKSTGVILKPCIDVRDM
jgi:hypothetical protein